MNLVNVVHHTFVDIARSNPVIVDLGAHMGEFSEEISKMYSPEKIIMVEPHPELYRQLPQNMKSINAAITPDGEDVVFHISKRKDACSIFKEVSGYFGKITDSFAVPGITLRSIIDDLDRVDLLKIDIEGAEFDLLQSFTDFEFNMIDQITVEFHNCLNHEWQEKTENCIEHLQKLGYSFLEGESHPLGHKYFDCLFYKET
jgi:FkbM family methyltransferase